MHAFTRTIVVAVPLLLPPPAVVAQTAINPSGHWQGSLQAPDSPISFEVDLAKNGMGELSGTLSIPSQQIRGLPLIKIDVAATAVKFQARSDQSFSGVISDDGTAMAGRFSMSGGAVVFNMTRSGPARIEAPVTSPPIAKDLEGTWLGALIVEATTLRLVLTMANQLDGTAAGRMVNVDQGGLQVPVSIGQDGSSVTIESRVIAGSFSGRLNATGTTLVGTFTQGPLSSPLTFIRQP